MVEPDLVLKVAEAPPGTGIMDLDAVVESCRLLPEDSTLVVEHFGPEESEAALRVVAALARKHDMLESLSGAVSSTRTSISGTRSRTPIRGSATPRPAAARRCSPSASRATWPLTTSATAAAASSRRRSTCRLSGTRRTLSARRAGCRRSATRSGVPAAIVGAAELESSSVRDTLQAHLLAPSFRGVRQILAWHEDPALAVARPGVMEDGAWRRGFALLAPLGLSFDLTVYPAQLAAAAALAADFPATSIILDHAGLPEATGQDRAVWREGMERLAACENVTVKLSGLTLPGRSVSQMSEYAEEVLALFGCERAMFGSNLPVEHLNGSPESAFEAVERALDGRSGAEREAVWAGTATRVYRLAPAVPQ